MLICNLRHSGWLSNVLFADRPEWSDLSGPLTLTQVAARLSGKRVCVLLHGYRNTEDAAEGAYAQIRANFESLGESPYDEWVGVLMPLSRLKLGFQFARMRAAKAGKMLAGAFWDLFLCGVYQDMIDVQTHSLGGMVALEALREGLRCRNLIMSAPAVDNEALEPQSRYGAYLARAKRIFVAFSNHDPVDWFYRIASRDKMLGVHGPQSKAAIVADVEFVDYTEAISKHSGYKECPAYLSTWRRVARA